MKAPLTGIANNHYGRGSITPKPVTSSHPRENSSSTEGVATQSYRQPGASSLKLQQAYHEKELLLQEVVNLKDQLRKLEGRRNFGGDMGRMSRLSENSSVNTDPKVELILDNFPTIGDFNIDLKAVSSSASAFSALTSACL